MGKGDKRTAKGKRTAGSYGKSRPKPKLKYSKPVEEKESAEKSEE